MSTAEIVLERAVDAPDALEWLDRIVGRDDKRYQRLLSSVVRGD